MKYLLMLLAATVLQSTAPVTTHGKLPDGNTHIRTCDILPDGVVYLAFDDATPKALPTLVVRLRSFDRENRWIADDLVVVDNDATETMVPIVRPPSSRQIARVDCSLDARVDGQYALAPTRDISYQGDLSYCGRDELMEPVDDNGPFGSIESISIGERWIGVSFHVYVNGFMEPQYGRLHGEPFVLSVDGKPIETLRADGLSADLSFFAPVVEGPHTIKVTFGDSDSGIGWAACLKRVGP